MNNKRVSLTFNQLKRLVKESFKKGDVIFGNEYFDLVRTSGVGYKDTEWTGLEVVSKGLAKKHVVEIELRYRGLGPDFNGAPVKYEYTHAEIAHGNRMASDTLEETEEYIEALQEAVKFAKRVNEYLANEYDSGDVEEVEELDEDFDDPNPSIKSCPVCGRPMHYDTHSMAYNCPRCHHYERGRSRVH